VLFFLRQVVWLACKAAPASPAGQPFLKSLPLRPDPHMNAIPFLFLSFRKSTQKQITLS